MTYTNESCIANVWSSVAPTKPGWYWYLGDYGSKSAYGFDPVIICVLTSDDGSEVFGWQPFTDYIDPIESLDGLWMGPLTAPRPATLSAPIVTTSTLNKEELLKVKHYLQIAHDEAEAQHDVSLEYTFYEVMKETEYLIDRINHLLVD